MLYASLLILLVHYIRSLYATLEHRTLQMTIAHTWPGGYSQDNRHQGQSDPQLEFAERFS